MSGSDEELDKRRQAIRWYRAGVSYTTICERLHRSRPWLAKWVARFKVHSWRGLRNQSRRPRHFRRPVSATLAKRIVAVRAELEEHRTRRSRYRGVGAVDVQDLLRQERRRPLPSLRTIERVLQRAACGRRAPRRGPLSRPPYPHLRATQAGDLQQTDLVGPRYLRTRPRPTRFYSLHTIAVIGRGAWASQHRHKTAAAFEQHFVQVWQHLGVPRVSQLDNEMAATGGGRHAFGLSRVVRLHLLVRTHLVFVPKGEPGRNQLVESFNALWQQRVLGLELRDLRRVREASRGFLRFYHDRKAHRALTVARDGTRFPGAWLRQRRDDLRWVPADFAPARYASARGQLPVAAGRVSWIQRVDADGCITINARPYFVGRRRTGHYVQATLYTRRQVVVVYSAERRRLKVFPFPIREEIIRPVL